MRLAAVLSRWPVVIEVPLVDGDVDGDGRLSEEGAVRLARLACAAYLDGCTALDREAVEVRAPRVRLGDTGASGAVSVAANAVEVYDDTFTIAVRVRPSTGDGVVADLRLAVAPAGGVGRALRDELIARAQSAPHHH